MKKLSLYGAALLAMGIGFTACDQLHNDLRLDPPTNYVLETPSNADQLIIFGLNNSNVNNQLEVVTFNPYNITTEVDFQVQVAKSEADFMTWDDLVSQEGAEDGDYNFTNNEGLPYVVTINQIFTSPSFTIDGSSFCNAINEVYGFEGEFEEEVVSVAYRVHAWVPNVGYSSIFSNPVTLSRVQTYDPGKEPKKIYLIGQPQGWSIDNGDMYAEETEVGSNIYKNTFYIGAGKFQFRFYSELGDWDTNSIGSQDEDSPIDIEFTNDVYDGPVVVYNAATGVLGKGSWQNNSWPGGTVDVTVNLNDYTISMVAHEGAEAPSTPTDNVLYLIGDPQGWNISSSDMIATETSKGSNIYTGIFDIEAGKFMFRFYSALGDWESNSIGSQVEDSPIDISFTNGAYSGECVSGKGSWNYPDWAGGTIKVEINLNDMTITMSEYNDIRQVYIVGQCQGWDINSDAMALEETGVNTNVYTGTFNINSGDLQFKVYTELGDWDANAYGSTEDGADTNTEISVPYSGTFYPGKGNWHDPNFGGSLTITMDFNTNEITMTPK